MRFTEQNFKGGKINEAKAEINKLCSKKEENGVSQIG